MPKAAAELVIIEKSHELLVWTLKHIEKFPRSHRYGVGLRLEERITEVLELLVRAKYSSDRRLQLQAINIELELLRFQYRAVKDLGCLSVDSYGSAARFVNEIGKLLGGWIRQSGGTDETTRKSVAGTGQLPKPPQGGSKGGPR